MKLVLILFSLTLGTAGVVQTIDLMNSAAGVLQQATGQH
jgi:hypothetical protein